MVSSRSPEWIKDSQVWVLFRLARSVSKSVMELLDGAISAPMTSVKQMARAHGDIGREAESGQHVGVTVLVSAGCGNRYDGSTLRRALVTRTWSDTVGRPESRLAWSAEAVTLVFGTAERRRCSGDAVPMARQLAGGGRVLGADFNHCGVACVADRGSDRSGSPPIRITAQRVRTTGKDSRWSGPFHSPASNTMNHRVVLRWTEECWREGFVRCWLPRGWQIAGSGSGCGRSFVARRLEQEWRSIDQRSVLRSDRNRRLASGRSDAIAVERGG